MKKYFSLPISIHCWGGLGSQLFTWAMAEKIAKEYPRRKIKLVLHSSGVTKRDSSVDFLSQKYQIVNINDFQKNEDSLTSATTPRRTARDLLSNILQSLRFICHANTDDEFAEIRSWTLVLRGHYSHQKIDEEIVQGIISQFSVMTNKTLGHETERAADIAFHYRLGDLLSLSNKSYVDPSTLSKEIKRIAREQKRESVVLYSDSPIEAKNKLNQLLQETQIIATEIGIWETVSELVGCKFFIGTNSKISIWVALFRRTKNINTYISLPITMKEEIERIYPEISSMPNFAYYS